MSRKNITIDQNFSDRFKYLMESVWKIKPAHLAKMLNVTASYISMVARGKRSPSAEMIIGIYLNYGSYIEWLITGQGPVCRQTATVNDSALDAAHGIDPKTSEFLRMTHDVLASGTIYAKALEQNIMAFHRAMMHDKLQAYDEDTIEERLRKIEYRLKLINGGIDDKQVEQPGDATRKEGIATELMPEGPKLGNMEM